MQCFSSEVFVRAQITCWEIAVHKKIHAAPKTQFIKLKEKKSDSRKSKTLHLAGNEKGMLV